MYTHKYSNFPNQMFQSTDFRDLKDAPSNVISIVNQIETHLSSKEYSQASALLEENKTLLSPYLIGAEFVNSLNEEIRNVEIYTKSNKTGQYYTDQRPDAVKGDIWIGDDRVSPVIVTWEDGTYDELKAMLNAYYAGYLNIYEHWHVGDEKVVKLNSMPSGVAPETHSQQSVSFVLMNAGGKKFTNGRECAFVVGIRDIINTPGIMNDSASTVGGWDTSLRREWCNTTFKDSIPSGFGSLFKQFNNFSWNGGSGFNTLIMTSDFFALPSLSEVYSFGNEYYREEGSQFEYYKNFFNRRKSGRVNITFSGPYWSRSHYNSSDFYVLGLQSHPDVDHLEANYTSYLSPFGCI